METEAIRKKLEQNAIPFSEELPGRIAAYLKLLQEWNPLLNPKKGIWLSIYLPASVPPTPKVCTKFM